MRISDWSSDVCSSDLADRLDPGPHARPPADVAKRGMTEQRVVRRDQQLGVGRLIEVPAVAVTLGLEDRKSVVSGQSVSVRVDLGVRRIIKKNINNNYTYCRYTISNIHLTN